MASIEHARRNQVEQLQAKALEASFDAIGFDFTGTSAGEARATIARAQVALIESKSTRLSTEGQQLANAFATYQAMRRFVKDGTLARAEDIENLAGALVDAAPLIQPSKALMYLGRGGNHLIRRPVSPTELVGALGAWTELVPHYGYVGEDAWGGSKSPRLPLSVVINSARQVGCDLADPSEEDVALVAAAIDVFDFSKDVTRVDDEGTIFHTRHRIVGAIAVHRALGSGIIGASTEEYVEPYEPALPEWDE